MDYNLFPQFLRLEINLRLGVQSFLSNMEKRFKAMVIDQRFKVYVRNMCKKNNNLITFFFFGKLIEDILHS